MTHGQKPNYSIENEPRGYPASDIPSMYLQGLRALASRLKGVGNERQELLALVVQARIQALEVVNEADEILETFSPKDTP